MDSLTGILAFVRSAEHLSFVAAGRALGLSASAIGKSVAKLEQELGVRLFNRTTRSVSLTSEGALFYERCRRIINDLQEAEASISNAAGTLRGRLRVGLPTIGYRFLLPVLPEFHSLYPDIKLDIDFSDSIVDLADRGLDAVIRSGDLADSSLMSRRLGPFRFLLCAAPAYLATYGTPQSPRDLDQHKCLHFRYPTSGKLQAWALADQKPIGPLQGTSLLTCNNVEALLGAAIAGMGIAYLPDFLAQEALKSQQLRPVLDDLSFAPGQFSILWPSSRLISPRLRAFVDFASEHLFPSPSKPDAAP